MREEGDDRGQIAAGVAKQNQDSEEEGFELAQEESGESNLGDGGEAAFIFDNPHFSGSSNSHKPKV